MSKQSRKQERALANELGGRRVGASGAGVDGVGDVRSTTWLAEAKRTDGMSYSLKKAVWEKAAKEAASVGRKPLLQVDIQNTRLVVLRLSDFLEIEQERRKNAGSLPDTQD